MPEPATDDTPGDILKFTNYNRQMHVPYIIYADFESLNVPVEGCSHDPNKSSTRQIAKQPPCSNYYTVVCYDGHIKHGQLHRGENTVGDLIESLGAHHKAPSPSAVHTPALRWMPTRSWPITQLQNVIYAPHHSVRIRCVTTATSRVNFAGRLTVTVISG
jgi:hypothetical protein